MSDLADLAAAVIGCDNTVRIQVSKQIGQERFDRLADGLSLLTYSALRYLFLHTLMSTDVSVLSGLNSLRSGTTHAPNKQTGGQWLR